MGDETVKVVVRCRPFNSKEKTEKRGNIIQVDEDSGSVSITNPSAPDDKPKSFTFDSSFDDNSIQSNVYDELGYPLVEVSPRRLAASCNSTKRSLPLQNVMKGFNGTIFAYGQTGVYSCDSLPVPTLGRAARV